MGYYPSPQQSAYNMAAISWDTWKQTLNSPAVPPKEIKNDTVLMEISGLSTFFLQTVQFFQHERNFLAVTTT